MKPLEAIHHELVQATVFADERVNREGSRNVDLKKGFHTALKDSGINDFRWHDLRHTFASWWVQGGGDLYRLSRVLGHSTLQMSARYGHLRTDDLHDEMAGLAQKWSQDRQKEPGKPSSSTNRLLNSLKKNGAPRRMKLRTGMQLKYRYNISTRSRALMMGTVNGRQRSSRAGIGNSLETCRSRVPLANRETVVPRRDPTRSGSGRIVAEHYICRERVDGRTPMDWKLAPCV